MPIYVFFCTHCDAITICVCRIDSSLAFHMQMVDKGILHACYLIFYTLLKQDVMEWNNVVPLEINKIKLIKLNKLKLPISLWFYLQFTISVNKVTILAPVVFRKKFDY